MSMNAKPRKNLVTRAFGNAWLFILWLSLVGSQATTYTWTGTGFFGQDFLWSNDFNWAGGVAPSANETNVTIIFPNDNSPRISTNDVVGLKVNSIQFQGTNYVVHGKPAGNTLNFLGTGLGGWAVLASRDGNYFASTCPLNLNNSGFVAVSSGCTFSVLSTIGGAGGLTKSSPGTLKFAAGGANTYVGTTTVTDGTLDLNNGTFIPSATYVAVAGPLVIGSTNFSFAPLVRWLLDNQVANTTLITVNPNGRLWLNGQDDTLGSLSLMDGAQVSTGVGGGLTSPGTLTLSGNVTNAYFAGYNSDFSGNLNLAAGTRIFHTDGWLRLSGSISGSGGITKYGYNSLQYLYCTNTYSGATIVHNGTLHVVAGSTPLGSTGTGTTVDNYGELYLEGANISTEPLTLISDSGPDTVQLSFRFTNVVAGAVSVIGPCHIDNSDWNDADPEVLTFSGAISGAGSLRKTGLGWMFFSGFGGNTFSGGLICEEGWTWLNKSASAPALSGPLVVGTVGGSSGGLDVMQINQIPDNLPVSILENSFFNVESNVSETIGPLAIMGGTVLVDGTLTLGGDVTNRYSSVNTGFLGGVGGSIVLPGTRIVHSETNSYLFCGSIWSGSGGVTKTGPGEMSLYGMHTYSGATTIKEGMLTVGVDTRLGSVAAGTTVEADGVLRLYGASITNESLTLYGGGSDGAALIYHNTNVWSGTITVHGGATCKAEPTAKLTVAGTITGDGGFNSVGDGRLILSGPNANSFSGPTTFRLGTLELSKPNGIAAIPDSLTVGYSTNGAPGALVKCNASGQFAPAGGASLLINSVTLNENSTFDCGGFNQSVPNLNLTRATIQTGAGVLSLAGDLRAYAVNGTSSSYVLGNLQLQTGLDSTHGFQVDTDALLWCNAAISETGGPQKIQKLGSGQWLGLGDVSITGDIDIQAGRWLAGGSNPFGSAAAPTIVEDGASLVTFAGTFAEPLQLSGGGDGSIGALYSSSTNSFTGPIILNSNAVVYAETNGVITLIGAISGPGNLVKDGGGLLKFSGTDANTFAGVTIVNRGKLELGKSGAVAVPGPLTCEGLGPSSGVRLMLANQISDSGHVQLNGSTYLDLNGNSDTIGSIAGTGSVLLGTGTLTTGGNNVSSTLAGSILGSGGITKTGTGTFSLTALNSYTGTTTVNGGTLLVFGQQPSSPVSINTGGTLGGTGKVGNISDLNGHVSPGASPGILVCSNYSTFTPANLLQIDINGAVPGSGYDQLQVNGNVLLMGGMVQVAMNYGGAVSNTYVIISNDGNDSVSGTFTGLTEGAVLTNNGVIFQITYHGGDGNDVALIQKNLATGPLISAVQIVSGLLNFTATGQPGALYTVEAATSLTPPIDWTNIGSAQADGGGVIHFSDPDTQHYSARFYRLRLP